MEDNLELYLLNQGVGKVEKMGNYWMVFLPEEYIPTMDIITFFGNIGIIMVEEYFLAGFGNLKLNGYKFQNTMDELVAVSIYG